MQKFSILFAISVLLIGTAQACPKGQGWYLEYFAQKSGKKIEKRYIKHDCKSQIANTPIKCHVSTVANYTNTKKEKVETVTLTCSAEEYEFMSAGSYYPQRRINKVNNNNLYISYLEDEDSPEDKKTFFFNLSCFPKPKPSQIDNCITKKTQQKEHFSW